ncbi:hypothetical protein ACFYRC_30460 [Streptomyces sp. NPDC005279]|uniref:hypothetical protein n=1 Tax=Streptomyces sp. NPDC005279 TaxID=3364712 RepID=UPI003674E148
MHVLDVTRDPDVGGGQGLVVLDAESDADLTGCPDCGVVAAGHIQLLHDAPPFGTPEVRRRVQPATLGRRGHKDDPLHRNRRTLLTGVEQLTDRLLYTATSTPARRRRHPPLPVSVEQVSICRTSRPRLIYEEPDHPSVAAPGAG